MSDNINDVFLLNERQMKRFVKRKAAERRFQWYGMAAIAVSIIFLATLLFSIVSRGYTAFWHEEIQLPIHFAESEFSKHDDLESVNYRALIRKSLKTRFPDATKRLEKRQLYKLISKGAKYELAALVEKHPEIIGTTQTVWLPASSSVTMFMKGFISENIDENKRTFKDKQIAWTNILKKEDQMRSVFNWTFLTSGDSRNPEMAGIWGSMVGSLFTIIVCMVAALPIGVMTAVYLEEFAPKNTLTDIIEVNLNNLAAVPSIIFGLLGLAIFLGVFGMPRSAPIVGGITLSLMVLPTIVITTRNALKAVPPSIRDAALALGASPLQVTYHHTIPLAMPGIMTGAILSIARALGETAPLLMIGMVAFVADIPGNLLDPATTMPVQVYLWADSPELGFIERTSAAIMVLLLLLIAANALAVYLRKRYETRW